MRNLRRIVCLLVALSLMLSVLARPLAVSAAGVPALSADTVRTAREAYLNAKTLTTKSDSTRAKVDTSDDTMLAGVRVPPEIAVDLASRDTLDVIVTIPGVPSLAQYAAQHGTSLSRMASVDAVPVVAAERQAQEQVIGQITSAGVQLLNLKRSDVLVNTVSGTVAKNEFATLVGAVGVANVHIARIYTVDDTHSNPLIGSGPSGVWADPGVDGTGMYVGVVDTGVDYHHPDFGGTPSSTFPTAKIVAGYDFGDSDTDPMDYNGHGSHVSGIIAADGADLKGVAPKAKIVFAKIVPGGAGSASSEDIMHAFEYMADPDNLDAGPEGSHPAVASINMSFGSIAGWTDPTDPEQIAIQACVDNGIIVSLSAGNSNQAYNGTGNYAPYPDFSTVGSPSVTSGAISVASSENSWIPGQGVTETVTGLSYPYILGSTSPDPVVTLGDNGGAGYEYVYCGLGNTSDFAGQNLTGKVALMIRGTISFYVKINNAQAAGAVGAIIMNNQPGTFNMNTSGATLTSMSILQTDGNALKLKAAAPVGDGTGRLKFVGAFAAASNTAVDTISSFSSWGPAPDFSFKPEVTAPGGNIWSTVPVAQGSYANYSGTSMAAPHVAAAAALIKEQHPEWTPAQVKIALMNTAKLLVDPGSGQYYSPHVQGAGRINVSNALHNDVIVTSDNGLPYVNLGSLPSYQTVPAMFMLRLRNSGGSDATYSLGVTAQSIKYNYTAQAVSGVLIGTSPSGSVTVPAGGEASVLVTLDLTAAVLPSGCFPFIEGFVSLTPASGVALHIPYTGFMGSWNDFNKADAAYNPILDPEGDDPDYSFSSLLYPFGLTWPMAASTNSSSLSWLGQDFDGDIDISHIGWNPAVTGKDRLLASMYVLRDAANVTIDVKDSSGALIKQIDSYNGLWKGNFSSYGTKYSWWYSDKDTGDMWWWDGTLLHGAAAPDGTYHLVYTATPFKMFNSAIADPPQVIDFPVILDTVAPTATVTSVTAGSPGKSLVNFTGSDNAGGSGLWGYAIFYGDPAANPNTWAHTMLSPSATSVEIPAGNGFYIVAYDFADNYSIALQISTDSVPDAVVDSTYLSTLVTTGGTGAYNYTLTAGALPDGLTLTPDGTITGIPAVAGSFAFTVQVTDGVGSVSKSYTMTVYSSGLSITSPSPLSTGLVNVPYYQVLSAVGGDGVNYSWSLNGGTLPPGLGLNLLTPSATATTAALQGTPTAAGVYAFTLKVVSNGQAVFKDFTMTIEPVGALSGLIYHYYTSLLDHAPDVPGFLYWQSEIARVQSLGIDVREGFGALARVFVASPEYLAKGASDAAYVTDLYETLFNRTPTLPEVTYWTDLMASGMSRDVTLNWFVYSSECSTFMTTTLGASVTRPENNLVNDLYRGFLNRLPDTDGFNAQLTAMRAAQASDAAAVRSTALAIATNFANGPEYTLRARTDTQFIEDCYNGILRRGALPAEIQGWVDLLTAGASRTEVLTAFVNSPEFQARVDQLIAAGPYIP